MFRRSFLVASRNSELSFNTMPWLDKNHKPDTYGGFPFGNTRDSSMLQLKLWCFPNIWIFWYTKLYCDTFYEKKRTAVVCLVPRKDANILHPYCILWWKETLTQPRFLMNTTDKNALFGNLFLLQEHLQCILFCATNKGTILYRFTNF